MNLNIVLPGLEEVQVTKMDQLGRSVLFPCGDAYFFPYLPYLYEKNK